MNVAGALAGKANGVGGGLGGLVQTVVAKRDKKAKAGSAATGSHNTLLGG